MTLTVQDVPRPATPAWPLLAAAPVSRRRVLAPLSRIPASASACPCGGMDPGCKNAVPHCCDHAVTMGPGETMTGAGNHHRPLEPSPSAGKIAQGTFNSNI